MNDARELIENPDSWIIPLHDYKVVQICIGNVLQIHLVHNDSSSVISINDNFDMQIKHNYCSYSVESAPELIGPITKLLHKTIRSITAFKDGRLSIVTDDGISLSVFPEVNYESWEISISNGIRIVCMPGGSLAIWD
ncbi:MAG: DUF6188 family protein [Armatimonadota bacterium]